MQVACFQANECKTSHFFGRDFLSGHAVIVLVFPQSFYFRQLARVLNAFYLFSLQFIRYSFIVGKAFLPPPPPSPSLSLPLAIVQLISFAYNLIPCEIIISFQ